MFLVRIYLLLASIVCLPALAVAGPLNINSANPEQLTEQMVGVGPSKALAIVEYRGKHGPFADIDELVGVQGIGQQTIERNRGRITAGTTGRARE